MTARLFAVRSLVLSAVLLATGAAATAGDSCASAVPIALATPATGGPPTATITDSLDDPVDADWYRIDVAAGHACVLNAYAPNYEVIQVNLYGPDCLLASPPNEWNGYEAIIFPDSPMYVRILSPYGTNTPYALSVTDHGPATDDYPSQLGPNSPTLPLGGSITRGVVNFTGDEDVFRILAQPRQILRVNLTAPVVGQGAGASVRVGGRELAHLSASTWPSAAAPQTATILVPVPPTGGELSLRVSSNQSPSAYAVSLELAGTVPALDDYPGDCTSAGLVVPGSPAVRVACDQGEADALRLQVNAGHLYQVFAQDLSADDSVNWFSIRNPDCSSGATGSWYGRGLRGLYHYATSQAAPHLLLDGATFAGTRLFDVWAIDLGVFDDETGGTPASSVPLDFGASPTLGVIDFPNDVDVFRLHMQSSHEYRIDVRQVGSGLLSVELIDQSGAILSSLAGFPSFGSQTLSWTSQSYLSPPGSVTDRFLKFAASSSIAFLVRVSDLGPLNPTLTDVSCQSAIPEPVSGLAERPMLAPGSRVTLAKSLEDRSRYQVTIADQSMLDTSVIAVSRSCGTPMFTRPATASASPFVRQFETLSADTLTINIDASANLGASARTITVACIGPATDFVGDSPAGAANLPIRKAAVLTRVDQVGDLDFYRVLIDPHRSYQVQIRGVVGRDGALQITRFNPSSTFRLPVASVYAGGELGNNWSYWRTGTLTPNQFNPAELFLVVESGLYRADAHDLDLAIRVFDTLCPADWNADAATTLDDLLLFLTDWLAGNADFDDQPEPGTTLGDLFAYLNSWFVGCASN